ncbi:MAG: Bax inhibitor-1 family protein [Desulfuromonadaceae bacterium]|nr:Bax inhibitor-1 family protein [Desulfuromonadaceae bacterium]
MGQFSVHGADRSGDRLGCKYLCRSSTVSWVVSGIGVIVFTALTAYDTWKIKALAHMGTEGEKPAILGALTLYLDFINLFLMLLRFTGNRR